MTLEHFRTIKEQCRWGTYATLLLNERDLTSATITQFGTYWIEAGHHIRKQIADDQVLGRLLRHLLTPYKGPAIELFRGENRNRWDNRTVGMAWTANADIARMFGSGLNALETGGVLLKGRFDPEAIISGPNAHSRHLGEDQYTVDPFVDIEVSAVEFYPAFT